MSTQRIQSIDPTTATGSNKKFFDALQSSLGLIPNMTRAMAQSPAVLEGYIALNGALSKGTLGRKLGEELALTWREPTIVITVPRHIQCLANWPD